MTRLNRAAAVLCAAIVYAVVPSGAAAQSIRALAADQSVTGTLRSSDETLDDGSHFHVYRLSGSRGDDFRVELSSGQFDTFLAVIDDGEFRVVNDDVEPGNTNSELTFSVDRGRDFYVLVSSYAAGETGAYRLTVERLAGRGDPGERAVPIAADDGIVVTERGSLASSDPTLSGGEHYDLYEFTGRAGSVVSIGLESDEFDTYLILFEPGGDQVDIDDARGSTNSYLERVLPEDGTFEIMVTSYAEGETGSYELTYTVSPPGSAEPADGGGGVTVRGRLGTGDATLAGGEYLHRYAFQASAGERFTFELSSSDFDAYLILEGADGSWLKQNDDAGPDTLDSRLEVRLPDAGVYRLIVTTYAGGETGDYTLVSSTRFLEQPSGVAGVTVRPTPEPAPGPSSAPSPAADAGFYGVFVGISDYPGTFNDLDYCAEDAVDLHDVFLANRFSTSDRLSLLQDADATRDGFIEAVSRQASRVGPDDTLFIFYSGHGNTHPSATERDGTDESLSLYDEDILDDELAELLEPVEGRVVLVIDACYSAGLAKDVLTRPGWFGIFSSEEDVVSYVAREFRAGGYLSHFFQDALTGGADGSLGSPADNRLSMAELERFLFTQWYGPSGPPADSNQHLRFERNGVSVDEVLFRLASR